MQLLIEQYIFLVLQTQVTSLDNPAQQLLAGGLIEPIDNPMPEGPVYGTANATSKGTPEDIANANPAAMALEHAAILKQAREQALAETLLEVCRGLACGFCSWQGVLSGSQHGAGLNLVALTCAQRMGTIPDQPLCRHFHAQHRFGCIVVVHLIGS